MSVLGSQTSKEQNLENQCFCETKNDYAAFQKVDVLIGVIYDNRLNALLYGNTCFSMAHGHLLLQYSFSECADLDGQT
jgi:hypothetical protein